MLILERDLFVNAMRAHQTDTRDEENNQKIKPKGNHSIALKVSKKRNKIH